MLLTGLEGDSYLVIGGQRVLPLWEGGDDALTALFTEVEQR
ncbi:hypothetical protein O3Q52_32295 [Streptomyces sp. ActVer]|nr:hypothetical protein [Streptomyces sp. ActVer]MCZ4512761.1 hypothetical protein [Streptomyces sp. ActVer]